jgi:glycerophosphoryl diester phosphodiesterase family protein
MKGDRAPTTRGAGPPWILGRRGAPRDAPENTLAGFQRALELGADGVHSDVRRAAGGHLIVFADEVIERTTDGTGRLAERSLLELAGLDAGGWFAKRFTGEPIPGVDELLEVGQETLTATAPMHWIEIHESGVAEELARQLERLDRALPVRVAARDPRLCHEAADAGPDAVYCTSRVDEVAWELARTAPLSAVAAGEWPEPWAAPSWPCERWGLELDDPDQLLRAVRGGLSGVTTNEVSRAVTARTLAQLAPSDTGDWPLRVPELPLEPEADAEGGAWRGRWDVGASVRNPFPHPVRVSLRLAVRRGAFDCEGLPETSFELGPRGAFEIDFKLRGGSWSPGGDPQLVALFDWPADEDRAAGRLLFDAPLARRRHAVADVITRRLSMLRESPGQAEASMTMRRRGRELHVAVENAGGLVEPRVWVRLDGEHRFGGRGVRLRLPDDFDRRSGGVDFACGFLGSSAGDARPCLRRYSGGLEWGADPGASARLHSHLAR